MLKNITLSLILLFSIFYVTLGNAREEYAETTGNDCEVCHVDPLGGGELTATGQGYLLAMHPASAKGVISGGQISRLIKLLVGYLHILTAFLWFGTILYVHLVLKPAYASQGLPRGEVRVGLVAMAVMAVTGTILTYYKVPSLDLLISSRFGLLLLAKIIIFTIMVGSALVAVLIIGPKLRRKKSGPVSPAGDISIDGLCTFDGQEGRPAYLAFKGKIYDVSGSKLWGNGSHMKRHQAGVDLTDTLPQAPHGEDKILAMPEVGRLTAGKSPSPHARQTKVFYFMAYMNLGFVFLIIFILALWRWY